MNWSLLSEKFGREENSILIFCASEDRSSDWIANRVAMYKKDGYKVIVKTARQGGYQASEPVADEPATEATE